MRRLGAGTGALIENGCLPAAGVVRLTAGGRSLLYAPACEQILELNNTADRVWSALVGGESLAAAAARLDLPLPLAERCELITETASAWVARGYLVPRRIVELMSFGPAPDRTLALDDLALELWLTDADPRPIDDAFGHLYGAPDGPRRRLVVCRHAAGYLFYLDGRLARCGPAEGLLADLKALLTEAYVAAVDEGFLAHCALLTRCGSRLLLSGAPGAGKSTLALALASSGWTFGGDDIVRIDRHGAARPAPFPATVKTGALSLLAGRFPALAAATAWRRSDGQQARYVLPTSWAPVAPAPPTHLLLLERVAGAEAALRPVSTVEALSALLGSAYARRWRLDGESLAALVAVLDAADRAALTYDRLDAAVAAVASFSHVQTKAA